MKAQRLSLVTLSLLSFLLLAACAPHDLDEAEGGIDIEVQFLWDDDPTAAPSQMGLWLYPDDGRAPEYYMFSGRDGGRIRVVPGRYRAIAYNADTETVLVSQTENYAGATFSTPASGLFAAYAPESVRTGAEAPRAPGATDEPVMMPPDRLWTGTEGDICFQAPGDKATIHMRRGTCTYDVIFRNVGRLESLLWASATLSGMAGTLRIADNDIAGPLCTLPFDITPTRTTADLKATFQTFGHCPEPAKHFLMLYTELTDGRRLYYPYDVTDQVHAATDKRHVTIIIDGFFLPVADPDANAAVQVSPWDIENVSVNMQ